MASHTPISLEKRLANEESMHAQAFETLSKSFDRIAEDLAAERWTNRHLVCRIFRLTSRLWFAKGRP